MGVTSDGVRSHVDLGTVPHIDPRLVPPHEGSSGARRIDPSHPVMTPRLDRPSLKEVAAAILTLTYEEVMELDSKFKIKANGDFAASLISACKDLSKS